MIKKKNSATKPLKHCPFIDNKCLGSDCMIYHDQFGRCQIELLTFNLFRLTSALQNMDDNLPPIKS